MVACWIYCKHNKTCSSSGGRWLLYQLAFICIILLDRTTYIRCKVYNTNLDHIDDGPRDSHHKTHVHLMFSPCVVNTQHVCSTAGRTCFIQITSLFNFYVVRTGAAFVRARTLAKWVHTYNHTYIWRSTCTYVRDTYTHTYIRGLGSSPGSDHETCVDRARLWQNCLI